MSDTAGNTVSLLRNAIIDAMGRAMSAGELPLTPTPNFTIETPADRTNGDLASNVAMVSARAFKKAPRAIAEAITKYIELEGTNLDRFEIAGPGFINFFYGKQFYTSVIREIEEKGADYGKSDFGQGKRILVEFVSANPTGPMHIGNARGGALGDSLASVLSAAGYDVSREFYVNDAGNQIEKFATSLEIRYLQLYKDGIELPEDAYHGQDIIDHAKNFAEINGDKYVNAESSERRKALVDFALPKNIQGLENDLLKYRIKYDRWFRESTLHQSGAVKNIVKLLKEKGHTYEQDGAIWFKATEFGADKDFVLVRSNGIPTYVVPDIAYHYDKLVTRGFDKAIDVLGADHHGYVPRLKAALTALGVDASRLDAVLMQMVRLVRNGEIVKASKRSGKAITLVTLLEEVPIDAARFFFNLREPNSHFDFDLDLAIEQSSQNPVYYVQYAHARICNIVKGLAESGITQRDCTDEELALLTAPEEIELINKLASLTGEIITSAKTYDPARVTHYVYETATLFHKFYNACRVKGEDESLMQARLALCVATKTVIENVLTMFKITAPESM
ncbi:MAG: arginine--tRNA ligase [Candidatus Pseudoruminococcus sp.]|uniref:arginine--tRNA ligase n=1 Tax=Candidatus Pseudoruminococcus sp. TaxID=3101048 RepID=UPI002A7BCEEA|nr:arginine--tRNA ligase [Ruminococcus sp.]MDY2783801.1 arginine--tRNA ligase [Candidatus Pseudoruminococcus sp.]